MFRIYSLSLSISLLVIFSLMSCNSPESSNSSAESVASVPKVVTTTGMIGDAVKNIVGELCEVTSLMGSGVDPHYYVASLGDQKQLRAADAVVYNGIRLEGKMEEVLNNLSRSKPVYAMASGVPADRLRRIGGTSNEVVADPHIWFDVALWAQAVQELAIWLGETFPQNRQTFAANADSYVQQLDQLHSISKNELAKVPENRRILITSHDAFGYFGDAYNFKVRGLQGLSTVNEFGLKDVSDLVDYISKSDIPAVFVESSVSPKSIESVVKGCKEKGHELKIGGELFSDAMGEEGTKTGNYIGMVQHNVTTVIAALK